MNLVTNGFIQGAMEPMFLAMPYDFTVQKIDGWRFTSLDGSEEGAV